MARERGRRYMAFMLRLWETADGDQECWRASLQQVPGRERRGFDDLEKLFAYLRLQVTEEAAPPGKEGEEV
jgi:hypothetical protein